MAIWFTADTHFSHQRILLFRKQFSTVDEMNELMVERWNGCVKKGDLVYHLGDVALGNPAAASEIIKRLNGQIYLVRGNHERVAEHKLCRDRFVWIKDYHKLKVGEQKIYLCHYAFRTWNCMHHGSINLFGHSHNSLSMIPGLRQMDVGVDGHDFYPWHHDEIKAKMGAVKFVPVDHHVENIDGEEKIPPSVLPAN